MVVKRPKYLNLLRIKLPLPGVVSFFHRVSGALLFAAVPLFLAVLNQTLVSKASFETVRQGFAHPLVKLLLVWLLWSFLHHFFAGLRFLAMDLELGLDLDKTRRNSRLVLIFSLGLTGAIGGWLW